MQNAESKGECDMPELKFDKTKCDNCKTISCMTKCQYMNLDKDAAKREWQKVRLRYLLCL
jgi:hypothetical protein